MRASELMIGDWVLGGMVPQRVKNITQYLNGGCVATDVDDWNDDQLQPIPLTPEILEKNGFPYDKEERLYYPFSNKAFAIERDEHDDKVFYYSMYVYNPYSSYNWHEIIEIRYVHQLQHALRLCGIEKEVVL